MPLCLPASRVLCSLFCHAAASSNLTRAAHCCEFFVAWTALPMRFCVHLCWLTFTRTVATSLKLQLHASNGLTQGRGEAEAALQPHSSSAFALTRFKRCCWGGSEGPVSGRACMAHVHPFKGWGTAAVLQHRPSCTGLGRRCTRWPSRARPGRQSLQGTGVGMRMEAQRSPVAGGKLARARNAAWPAPGLGGAWSCGATHPCRRSGLLRHSRRPRPRCTRSGRHRSQRMPTAGQRGHLRWVAVGGGS